MKIKKLKLTTIVGTRPEIIRLSRTLNELDSNFEHTLVHTGQNFDYELNEIFFNDLEIRKPDVFLNCAAKTPAKAIANVIEKSDSFFSENPQDALLILGDTNSSLAAISAKRRKIPIFHMEAGNRSFDQRVPEEINRKIVDHISDINLPYTSIAKEYLIAEGLKPEFIIKTGSPLDEVINHYMPKINKSKILSELKLKTGGFFLVSAHREENIETNNFFKLVEVLNLLAKKCGLPILVSTHPRTKNKIAKESIKFHKLIQLHKPLNFTDYSKLQLEAKVVLSDSGSITEESSLLNFPALNLREAHERPEGFEEGSVMMTGMNINRILSGIEILETQTRGDERMLRLVQDYSSPNLSKKMVRIILSYTDYVNTNIWRVNKS
jgi:UDP-N-acetylglucosamine 2-epimerase (non-hydrolysing)